MCTAPKLEPEEEDTAQSSVTPRDPKFDDLVLKYQDMLYGVAMKLARNRADAADLVQDTILKALRFHDKFQHGSYIKAWLLTILRNTFINQYRRKVRQPPLVGLTGAEVAPETGLDSDMPSIRVGARRAELLELLSDPVRKALDKLPDDFRQAVIMVDIEDKSYKEVAEVTDRPIGTVMSRLHRGRKLLREALGDFAEDTYHIREHQS